MTHAVRRMNKEHGDMSESIFSNHTFPREMTDKENDSRSAPHEQRQCGKRVTKTLLLNKEAWERGNKGDDSLSAPHEQWH